MTLAMKKVSNLGRLLSVTVLITLLGGCGSEQAALDNYSQLLSAYMESPSKQTMNNLDAGYAEVGFIGYKGVFETRDDVYERERRWRSLKIETQNALIENAQWETLSSLYRKGMRASYKAEDLLSLKYKGSDATLLTSAGWGAYRKGELYQAYKVFEAAALADSSNAYLPRSFAFHYGCADLYRIWGELATTRIDFEGDAIPLSKTKLSRRELIEARTQLRKGVAPEITESCPIKPV